MSPSKTLPVDRYGAIAIHSQLGIAYHERVIFFMYAILRVEEILLIKVGSEIRTGHGAKLFPAVPLRLLLDKSTIGNIASIIVIIIVASGGRFGVSNISPAAKVEGIAAA